MKSHRDLPPLPTTQEEIKAEIAWIWKHPIWEHPYDDHSIDGDFHDCVQMDFAWVNPKTGVVDDDESKNTQFEVWLESGNWIDLSKDEDEFYHVPDGGWNDDNKWMACHDIRLDCGGTTMEIALCELARLVRFFYHDDGTPRKGMPEQCGWHVEGTGDSARWVDDCVDAGDGYCKVCGFRIGKDL